MEGSSREGARRTFTPAVVGSSLFVVACGLIAIAFVAARGSLQLPVAATLPPAALASPDTTSRPTSEPRSAPPASASASASALPPATGVTPSIAASPQASTAPSPGRTAGLPSLDPNDPLLALPPCPALPGCFEYLVQRGETLSGIASRFVLPVSTVLALNPELADPGTVVVGQVLYLGRDPMLRLEPCPDAPDCALYVVRPGDGLATIAARFDLTIEDILEANPTITDQNQIFSGQALRLPRAP